MSTVEYQPRPVRVSPLIKFFRWSFLGLGIVYGLYHHSRLSKKAAGIREIENKQKAIRDAKLAEEKRIANLADIKMFEDWSKPVKS